MSSPSIHAKLFCLLLALLLFIVLEQQQGIVEAAKGSERTVVIVDGKSYDVTEFKHKHPGGQKVLEVMNGKDVKDYLLGKMGVKLDKDQLVKHKHVKEVFDNVLPKYEIKH